MVRRPRRPWRQAPMHRAALFRWQYAQLLQQLSYLPGRPTVLVTGYYDSFGMTFDCPALQDPIALLLPRPG